MEFIERYKSILILAAVAALAIGGYFFFIAGSDSTAAVALSDDTERQLEESLAIEQEIIIELRKIQSIRISEGIYDDPAFVSLIDFSRPIEPQAVGRENPFAPLP